MCLYHPLGKRNEIKENYSIEQYEKDWSKFEQNYSEESKIEEKESPFDLEIECVYYYNFDLLCHLLTSPRRRKFREKTEKYRQPVALCRTIAFAVLTGDYTIKELEKMLYLFYQSNMKLARWDNWISGKVALYDTYKDFKVIIYSMAKCIIEYFDKKKEPVNKQNLFLLQPKKV